MILNSKVSKNKLDVIKLLQEFIIVNDKLVRVVNYMGKEVYEELPCKVDSKGYIRAYFNGQTYPYHVLVWALCTGDDIPPSMFIDHINGNRVDNRFENLRLVTSRENSQNREIHRDGKAVGGTFGYNRYTSRIRIDDDYIRFGEFLTAEEANKVYLCALDNLEKYYTMGKVKFKEYILKKTYSIQKPQGYYHAHNTNTYNAYTDINGKRRHVGVYKTEAEAIEATKFASENVSLWENAKQYTQLVKSHVASTNCVLDRVYYNSEKDKYVPYVFIRASKLDIAEYCTKEEANVVAKIAQTMKVRYENPNQFIELVMKEYNYKEE